ncbi:10721_t:CDS:1, partial [Acaulospora colombiana]
MNIFLYFPVYLLGKPISDASSLKLRSSWPHSTNMRLPISFLAYVISELNNCGDGK